MSCDAIAELTSPSSQSPPRVQDAPGGSLLRVYLFLSGSSCLCRHFTDLVTHQLHSTSSRASSSRSFSLARRDSPHQQEEESTSDTDNPTDDEEVARIVRSFNFEARDSEKGTAQTHFFRREWRRRSTCTALEDPEIQLSPSMCPRRTWSLTSSKR